MPTGRSPGTTDVLIDAVVEVLEDRVERQFETTFAVRTYSIEVGGESGRSGESLAMPAPRTFSADSRFGRERIAENARLVAADVMEGIQAYWKKRAP